MAVEFDPHKRPPAARLLAVFVTAALLAWIQMSGGRARAIGMQRDPQGYIARLRVLEGHGFSFFLVVSLLLVTLIVFAVEGFTSLFSRWLTERNVEPPAPPPPAVDSSQT